MEHLEQVCVFLVFFSFFWSGGRVKVFQGCFRVFQGCFKDVSVMFQGCFKDVSIQECSVVVSWMLQEISRMIKGCITFKSVC